MQKPSIPYCPSCDHEITQTEINISEGVALCARCGQLSQLSSLNYLARPASQTLQSPPKSVKLTSDRESIKVNISLFSLLSFLGSLFVTLFWNGITCLFLSLAVAAVCYNTIGYVPDWLPAPGLEDGKPVMNDQVMGNGMTIFLCLFLTPFVTIGTVMIINTLLRIFGTTIIVIQKNRSFISTGISFLKFKKSFDPNKVTSIKIHTNNSSEGQQSSHILMQLEGRRKIKFGRLLNESQQEWTLLLIKQILIHKKVTSDIPNIPHLYWLK